MPWKFFAVLVFLGLLRLSIPLAVAQEEDVQSMNPQVLGAAIGEHSIKVMTYNIHHGDQLTIGGQREKIKKIAAYIKANNIEIAGLQEVSARPDPDVSDILDQELRAIGYPMFMALPPTHRDGQFKNVVISKYPILTTELFGQRPCGKTVCDRSVVVTQIQSPIGVIRFIDTHVHHGEDNCKAMKEFRDIVKPYQSDPMTIMVGDFNIEVHGKGTCDFTITGNYNHSCEQSNNCDYKANIDWILLPITGSQLSQVWRFRDTAFTESDHLPIISEIRLLNPPAPSKQGDLDKDQDIDLFDYNLLLGAFGKTGSPGFDPADIIKNGTVDIFDFNALIENFGK